MDNVTRRKGGRVGRDNIEGANDKGEREGELQVQTSL